MAELMLKEIKILEKFTKNRWANVSRYKTKRLKLLGKAYCAYCNEIGDIGDFYIKVYRHKICQKLARKNYYNQNREKVKNQTKAYDQLNKCNVKCRKKNMQRHSTVKIA